jgi:hypothetical protein
LVNTAKLTADLIGQESCTWPKDFSKVLLQTLAKSLVLLSFFVFARETKDLRSGSHFSLYGAHFGAHGTV